MCKMRLRSVSLRHSLPTSFRSTTGPVPRANYF